ncbi:MAG TPA: hypothetical protein VEG84_01075 [Thermoanaerobaculia bacterium]|nr:hypothetical protein [Thermoanaerobaculia bacterium]
MESKRVVSILPARRRRHLALAAATLLALSSAALAQSHDIEQVSLLGVKNALLERAATGAVELASRMLATPRCQQIFLDFHDPSGRTLQQRLDTLGYTGSGFLDTLRFANGERLDACQSSQVLAATAPSSHVIFLCGLNFFHRQRERPDFSAALVIHEMLHSLGLGENPPSSNEITARVIERCGP